MEHNYNRYSKSSFLTDFTNMYQIHPCLWHVSSKDYSKNIVKMRAYNDLAKLCLKINPEANIDFGKSKIKNLRTCSRKSMLRSSNQKHPELVLMMFMYQNCGTTTSYSSQQMTLCPEGL